MKDHEILATNAADDAPHNHTSDQTASTITSRLRSPAQSEASRRNGALSRGPATPEGKANSSRNSLRHGMLAKSVILTGESATAFQEIVEALDQIFQPRDAYESTLIDHMALAKWRLMRLVGMERAGMTSQIRVQLQNESQSRQSSLDVPAADQPDSSGDPAYKDGHDPATRAFLAFQSPAQQNKTLELMNRYESRCDRQFTKAVEALNRYRDRQERSGKPSDPEAPAA